MLFIPSFWCKTAKEAPNWICNAGVDLALLWCEAGCKHLVCQCLDLQCVHPSLISVGSFLDTEMVSLCANRFITAVNLTPLPALHSPGLRLLHGLCQQSSLHCHGYLPCSYSSLQNAAGSEGVKRLPVPGPYNTEMSEYRELVSPVLRLPFTDARHAYCAARLPFTRFPALAAGLKSNSWF